MSEIVNIVAVSCITLSNVNASLPDLLQLDKHKMRQKRKYLNKTTTGRSGNQFSGYFLRMKNCTLTIFKTGKIILNGVKGEGELIKAFDELSTLIHRTLPDGGDFEMLLPRIVNITGCRAVMKAVDLKKLQNKDSRASYEPEIFPNLQFIFDKDKKARGIVSKSGKIIVTGVTSASELELYLNCLQKIIESI
ncbi:TBP-related factor-like [Brevipalpus obovatus]|uniref:TBP-related factor-like n=1 Tax=Brevipalpus obovatus TaxID=246614 RepID=UPI003D9F39E5